jgi:hypothetical protein
MVLRIEGKMSNSLATYGHFMRRIRTVHRGIKYNTMLLYVRVSVVLIFCILDRPGGEGGLTCSLIRVDCG